MPGSTINTTVTTTVTLNSGTYTSPLRILSSAAIEPSAYAATGLVATTAGYVLNEGLITAGATGVGVNLAVATLTNNGTIKGGSGTNGGNAVDLSGGTLFNQGDIAGGSATGTGGIGIDLTAGQLNNYGIISGGAGATGGTGVYLLTNTFTNYGTIEGGTGSTNGIGLAFKSGGTLRNLGVIGGSDAVTFGTGASRLILIPTAAFTGAVVANAAYTNILELTSAATSGTLTGIDTQYQNFSTIAVDTGANWTLTGTSTLGGNTSLLVAGKLTNTGAVTGGNVQVVGGSLSNRGTIAAGVTLASGSVANSGTINAGSSTVGISVAVGQLTNTGTIYGDIGVSFASGGTLTNASFIAGMTDAVTFGTGAARLILDPGASFSGTIVTDASFGNTLELAGTSAATLTGALDTQYQGFGTIKVDSGANWTLTAPNTIAATTSVIVYSRLAVAGGLTNNGDIIGPRFGPVPQTPIVYLTAGTLNNIGSIAGVGVVTGSLTNSGMISGGAGVVSNGGIGVAITTGMVSNSGTITGGIGASSPGYLGVGGSGGAGVSVAAGILLNFSTITGGAGGNGGYGFGIHAEAMEGPGGAGVELAAGTLKNHGLVIGGHAGTVVSGIGAFGGIGVQVVAGALQNYGTIVGGAGNSGGRGVDANAGTVTNSGTIIGGAAAYPGTGGAGVWFHGAGTLIDGGFIGHGGKGTTAIYFGNAARLILGPEAQINGSVSAASTFSHVLELATGSGIGTIAGLGSTVAGFNTIAFDRSADWFIGGNTAGLAAGETITGFAYGDTIELTNFVSTHHSFNSSGLILAAAGTAETLGIVGTFSSGDFYVTNDGTNSFIELITVCFLSGTRILTSNGEVPVESLRAGDRVITHSGSTRPIAWIGSGRVLATRGRRTAATPVIIRKDALADNVPCRDLRVTKGHSLFIDGALIPVEFLVNHRSIVWDDRAQEVTIYHVELDTHDVLIADGAPAESYRDDGNRWLFHNANAGWHQPTQEPCAPILTGGPVVDALWRRLLDRAGSRPGLPQTNDPDLHLVVDGVRLDASSRHGDVLTFRLVRRPQSIRIVSRCAAPDQLGLARDPRELGVALRQIIIVRGPNLALVETEDERLADGYHKFEPTNRIRWTDGNGEIPCSLMADLSGPFSIELDVAGYSKYPLPGETEGRAAA
jgi:Hint domain